MNAIRISCLITRFPLLFLLACFESMPRPASGALVAADNASDSAYAAETGGAWKGLNPTTTENPPGMDNGGTGLMPWNFAGGYHAQQFSPYGQLNHFIDGVDFPPSSFNDLGAPAFALTNANQPNFGYTSRATRPFASPLTIGDTLSIDFDNPLPSALAEFDSAGFLFRLNTGGGPLIEGVPGVTERFGLFVTDGFNNDNWTTTDSIGLTDTGVNASVTMSGAQFRFTLMGINSYSMELIRLSDGQSLFERTGMLLGESAGPIDSIEITIFGNGSGNGLPDPVAQPTGEREFFFNNLRIETGEVLLQGDYNQDGNVDAADYVVWRKNNGTQDEYNTWRANFSRTAASDSLSNAAVPEPTNIVLLTFAATVGISRGRRIASAEDRRLIKLKTRQQPADSDPR